MTNKSINSTPNATPSPSISPTQTPSPTPSGSPRTGPSPSPSPLMTPTPAGADSFYDDTQWSCQSLKIIEKKYQSLSPTAQDQQQRWLQLVPAAGEGDYQTKALSIFAMIQNCNEPSSRKDEANRLLRFSMMSKWPSQNGGQTWFSNESAWDHSRTNYGIRIYLQYQDWIDSDLANEFELRIKYIAEKRQVQTLYDKLTENQFWIWNSSLLLSMEYRQQQSSSKYALLKTQLLKDLNKLIDEGIWEWGGYSSFTYSSIINIIDFTQDNEIQNAATIALDYLLIQQSQQSAQTFYAGPSTRTKFHEPGAGAPAYLTHLTTSLMGPAVNPSRGPYGHSALYLVSNYRILKTLLSLYKSPNQPFEAKIKTGSAMFIGGGGDTVKGQTNYQYFQQFIAPKFAMGSRIRTWQTGVFPEGFVSVRVQSISNPHSWVIAYPFKDASTRQNSLRSFGHANIGFFSGGGALYSSSNQTSYGNQTRIAYGETFLTREFDGCRAFLTDGSASGGTVYVAWILTKGKTVQSDVSKGNVSGFLNSTFKPASGVSSGEISIIEAGDSTMYGSYANFKQSIKNRMGANVCPTVQNGIVKWKTKDGVLIEYGDDSILNAKVSGTVVDVNYRDKTLLTSARIKSPFVNNKSIRIDNQSLDFSTNPARLSGNTDRVTRKLHWGL